MTQRKQIVVAKHSDERTFRELSLAKKKKKRTSLTSLCHHLLILFIISIKEALKYSDAFPYTNADSSHSLRKWCRVLYIKLLLLLMVSGIIQKKGYKESGLESPSTQWRATLCNISSDTERSNAISQRTWASEKPLLQPDISKA